MISQTPMRPVSVIRFSANTPKPQAQQKSQEISATDDTSGVQDGAAQQQQTPSTDAPRKKSRKNTYVQPRPKTLLMRMLGPVNRSVILRGLPIIRHIPGVNQLPMGRGLLKFTKIDFPKADLQELKKVVNKKTAAFLGPNHPEFFTDWMIDKEVSTRIAPKMASWADKGIVNGPGQTFWLWNNLISNVSEDEGGKGKEYSVKWALEGKAVLLHPEGTVHWTGNKVQKLFNGIVDMPMRAAKMVLGGETKDKRPVYAVPLVWKLNFTKDVSKALHKEMTLIEKKLDIPSLAQFPVAQRFDALQRIILERQEKKFGLPEEQRKEAISPENFFDRQENLQNFLLEQLEAKYGKQEGPVGKKIARLTKMVESMRKNDKESYEADSPKIAELRRLQGFSREVYNNPKLTQEEIAESLKRIRQKDFIYNGLLDKKKVSWKDVLHSYVPVPIAPRVAHIRLAGPAIEFTEMLSKTPVADEEAFQTHLLNQIQGQMQAKIDEINKEIEPVVSKFSHNNPFYTGQAKAQAVATEKPVVVEQPVAEQAVAAEATKNKVS